LEESRNEFKVEKRTIQTKFEKQQVKNEALVQRIRTLKQRFNGGKGLPDEDDQELDDNGLPKKAANKKSSPEKADVQILTYRRRNHEDSDDGEPLDLVKLASKYTNLPPNLRANSSNDEFHTMLNQMSPESRSRIDPNGRNLSLSNV